MDCNQLMLPLLVEALVKVLGFLPWPLLFQILWGNHLLVMVHLRLG
jgi:hypothetical protein